MVEGLLQGLVGALLAAGIVLLGDFGIKALLHRFPEFATAVVPAHDVLVTEILVRRHRDCWSASVALAMAVRRFLDV